MKSTAVIVIDGVLRNVVGSAVIPQGLKLYHALSTQFNVVLITDAQEYDKEETEYWLRVNGFNLHSRVVYSRLGADTVQKHWGQVQTVRQYGSHVELVVDPAPKSAAVLISNGVNVLVFSHAQYGMPEWKPDYVETIRPWDEILASQERERDLKTTDARFMEEEL